MLLRSDGVPGVRRRLYQLTKSECHPIGGCGANRDADPGSVRDADDAANICPDNSANIDADDSANINPDKCRESTDVNASAANCGLAVVTIVNGS